MLCKWFKLSISCECMREEYTFHNTHIKELKRRYAEAVACEMCGKTSVKMGPYVEGAMFIEHEKTVTL